MPDQLVGQRSTDAFQQQRVVGVLEHAAVSLLLDVLQIVARRPVRRVFLTHVTEPAGKFGESLAIGALAEPMDLQMIGFEENRTGEEGDYGIGIEQDGFSKKKEDYQLGAEGGAAWGY